MLWGRLWLTPTIYLYVYYVSTSWWRHQIEAYFRVTGHFCGDFTGPGEFPAQRPVTRSFGVFFDLRPNKRLSKHWWGWWFETSSSPFWRYCNVLHPLTTFSLLGLDCSKPRMDLFCCNFLYKCCEHVTFAYLHSSCRFYTHNMKLHCNLHWHLSAINQATQYHANIWHNLCYIKLAYRCKFSGSRAENKTCYISYENSETNDIKAL